MVLALLLPFLMTRASPPPSNASVAPPLTQAQAARFAELALRCIRTEYPNKLDHVMNDATEVQSPRALHPTFYGCFDWHSAVHGHWMLVRLLRLHPDLPNAPAIRAALDENLRPANLAGERAYLGRPNRQSFERTYGWAWLLKLAEELATWDDADGRRWAAAVQPLASALVARYMEFFPKQNYPIRTGVHPNTAFGLAFAWDYAKQTGDTRLADLVRERSLTYFGRDEAYPAAWEPGGEDFFSPALMEADLMRRVLEPATFAKWLRKFLPGLERGQPRALFEPAVVLDRTDPKLVHLDGLNLSRAWCMYSVAAALPTGHAAGAALLSAAERHAAAGLAHVTSGDYVGEHWLASFAIYMLSQTSPPSVTPRR